MRLVVLFLGVFLALAAAPSPAQQSSEETSSLDRLYAQLDDLPKVKKKFVVLGTYMSVSENSKHLSVDTMQDRGWALKVMAVEYKLLALQAKHIGWTDMELWFQEYSNRLAADVRGEKPTLSFDVFRGLQHRRFINIMTSFERENGPDASYTKSIEFRMLTEKFKKSFASSARVFASKTN